MTRLGPQAGTRAPAGRPSRVRHPGPPSLRLRFVARYNPRGLISPHASRSPPADEGARSMVETATEVAIRPVEELDIEDIAGIDERLGGRYRPEVWEKRVFYYLRRDPEGSFVATSR